MSRYSDPEDDYRYFHEKIDDQAARIAELEAKQETLIRWLVKACDPYATDWNFNGKWYETEAECEAAIRAAIESPDPR
jgi:hypothetical protein